MRFLSCQGNTIGFDKNRTICSAQDRPSWDIGSNLGLNKKGFVSRTNGYRETEEMAAGAENAP